MNILIIEAYTDANIGSGALVENSIALLRQRYPNATIRVMAHDPVAIAQLCDVEAVPDVFAFPYGRSRGAQVRWLLTTFLWMGMIHLQTIRPPRARVPFFHAKVADFLWADLVVSVGAERINDKYVKNVIFSLYTYNLIKRLGKRFVIFPSTIGPFLFHWSKWLSSRVLRTVDLIYTRDALSTELTQALPGMETARLITTADVAVMQQQISPDAARARLGAAPDDTIVGISVMRWTYVSNAVETPYSNYAAYVREMAAFADTIIDDYHARVILYPTNYPVHGCREDDVTTAREVRAAMRHRDEVTIIEELPTPAEFKGMLACSEVNITTRMHACILSTGAGVPTISVNYLFKLKEYMTALGLGEFAIDIEVFNAKDALTAFHRMWTERPLWRERVKQAIAEKQQQLLSSMESLDAL